MARIDRENTLDLDMISLQEIVPSLSSAELDRDLTEISNDVSFLQEQLRTDLASYTPKQLQAAYEKIYQLKQRSEILTIELDNRAL
jgi:hypothetical protein